MMLRYLVTGTGSSGTKYLTEYLKTCGRSAVHEEFGGEIRVGWQDAPLALGNRRYQKVLHVVRHPLRCIAGLKMQGKDSLIESSRALFGRSWGRHWTPDDLLLVAMKRWRYWNLLCEQSADSRIRLEDFDHGELMKFFGSPVDTPRPDIPRDTNSRQRMAGYERLTWRRLYETDAALAAAIFEQGIRYGYRFKGEA